MKPRLTILMPLKGRHLFTIRFLWHANKLRLPYRFLIADGQVNETLARHLEDSRSLFPELDIEYIRYADDTDYSCFFAKMFDAMQRVRTPYVMVADNDDFLGFGGIERALDFLDTNTDYVGARSRSVGFFVYSGFGAQYGSVCGRFNRLRMHSDFKDVAAPTATERLRQGGLSDGLYYAIYRTEASVTIWREVTEINFSDLMLHENFFALRPLTLGKIHIDKRTITYYTQALTGISHQPLRDWVQHLLRSRFTSDAHALIKRVSFAAAEADGVDVAKIMEEVTCILERHYRDFLLAKYGPIAQMKRYIRKNWSGLVSLAQNRPRFSVRRERASILSRLTDAGASSEDIRFIRDELTTIEQTLSPEAFADFAGPFLPMARGEGGREWLYPA